MKRLIAAAAVLLFSTSSFATTPAYKCADNYLKAVDKIINAYGKAALKVCNGKEVDTDKLIVDLNKIVATYNKKRQTLVDKGGACDGDLDDVVNTLKIGPMTGFAVAKLNADGSMTGYSNPANGTDVVNYVKTACDLAPPPPP